MMSTAVIVGEMSATDWARSVGNPRTPVRRPLPSRPLSDGAPFIMDIATYAPALTRGKDAEMRETMVLWSRRKMQMSDCAQWRTKTHV
jgi:hypothetical protein